MLNNSLFCLDHSTLSSPLYSSYYLNIISMLIIVSSILTIISKNPIFSVLFLIILFMNISFYLFLLGFNFLGLSYILVYVSAVSMLFLFILMLINIRVSELTNSTNKSIPLTILSILAFVNPVDGLTFNLNNIYYIFSNYIVSYVSSNNWDGNINNNSDITSIGNVMYSSHSIWLLLTSTILLLAMVGAIVITINPKTPSMMENTIKSSLVKTTKIYQEVNGDYFRRSITYDRARNNFLANSVLVPFNQVEEGRVHAANCNIWGRFNGIAQQWGHTIIADALRYGREPGLTYAETRHAQDQRFEQIFQNSLHDRPLLDTSVPPTTSFSNFHNCSVLEFMDIRFWFIYLPFLSINISIIQFIPLFSLLFTIIYKRKNIKNFLINKDYLSLCLFLIPLVNIIFFMLFDERLTILSIIVYIIIIYKIKNLENYKKLSLYAKLSLIFSTVLMVYNVSYIGFICYTMFE